MGKFIDLTGQKFGRLTVIEREGTDKFGNALWLCKCECGNEKIINGHFLRKNRSRSCGCLSAEMARERKIKHGMCRSKIYYIWYNIRRRSYGNGEIKVAECWLHNFSDFYDYVSKLPHFEEEGYSIDRINTFGNYEPGNVRWANNETQANNKRNNHLITYNGKTQTMSQWAREYGFKTRTLQMRLSRGWTIEKALNTSLF